MKKILSLSIVALMVIGLVAGGTWAFFSDTETSTGNQFAAGTLDLTIDGGNTDVQIFDIDANDAYPGNDGTDYAAMKNVGSVTGNLSIQLLNVLDLESVGTTEYESDDIGATHVEGNATGGSVSTVVDTGAGWDANAYEGRMVTVTGKGSGIISSNTADTLTISGEFSEAVVDTDSYMIIGEGELGSYAEIRIWVDIDKDGNFDDAADYLLLSNGNTSQAASDYATAFDAIADYAETWTDITEMAQNNELHIVIDWQIPDGSSSTDNTFQGDSVMFDIIFTLEQA